MDNHPRPSTHRHAACLNSATVPSFRADQAPEPMRHMLAQFTGHATIYGREAPWSEPTLGICSSHSKRFGFADSRWQQPAWVAVQFAKQHGYRVLIPGDAPYAPSIVHVCKRLGTSFSLLLAPESEVSLPKRILEVASTQEENFLVHEENVDAIDPQLRAIPLQDRSLIGLSNLLFVVQVSKGGKIEQLLSKRLELREVPSSTIKVAWTSSNDSRWIQRGAVGWFGAWSSQSSPNVAGIETSWSTCLRFPQVTYQPIARATEFMRPTSDRYLVHCTRARQGPWPDQSWEQYCDELLLEPQRADATPLQALLRILSTGKLIATRPRKPGGVASVSFSQQNLKDLLRARKYQRHLGRWDWEPYGLLLSLDRLQENGAIPVQYVDKKRAHQTPSSEWPMVQFVDDTGGGQDWRFEREWRVFDDVRLSRYWRTPGFVFVPSFPEARLVQHVSPWPVLVVG
ncbi:hypothetical protein VN12_26905 [Pirellula sp. SH-Sr6A]|uniref:hypothetical protein n=1 Tax=Pirellula sp. SH-Sr6A TaxID=1632865 RepID=UPI00078EBD13|nr:hypothetical protein [Pirellula sp. SH-Sr6A]AMV35751.1 hypothetical protein VN12_26905 [Pirellula sp. SH-Sr6A]